MNQYQEARSKHMNKSMQLVAATEAQLITLANTTFGEASGGTFDVIINDHIRPTQKAISQYMYDGRVVMYPRSEADYAWLVKYRQPDGGIDITAIITSKHRADHPATKEWAALNELATNVSDVLRKECLVPLYNLVSGIQQSYGYVPSHKRGLGAKGATSGNPDAFLNEVILKLIMELETSQFGITPAQAIQQEPIQLASDTKTESDAVLMAVTPVDELMLPLAAEVGHGGLTN